MICIPQASEFLVDGAADAQQVGATDETAGEDDQVRSPDRVPNMYSTVAELMADGVADEEPADVVQEQSSDPVPGRAPYFPTVAELMADGGADEKPGAAGSYRSR